MRFAIRRAAAQAALILVALVAVVASGGSTTAHADSGETGAVYTLTNEPTGNRVQIWNRAADGSLSPGGAVATGGLGTGAGLGSQGALVLSKNHRFLFAVNAGSNDVSALAIRGDHVILVDRIASGGARPISLTVRGDLLYVLNAGGAGNIAGFTVSSNGRLAALPGSVRALSGSATNPAQIQFAPNGRVLVVTEKATNLIDTFVLGHDGLPGTVLTHPSAGATPFGFAFDHEGRLFVSEAATSSLSSYDIDRTGQVHTLSAAVANHQLAACWVVVTENG